MKKLIPMTLGLALTFSTSAFAAQTAAPDTPTKTVTSTYSSAAVKQAASGGYTVKTDLNAFLSNEALLKLLNISKADLKTQLSAGKTLETIAKAKGIDSQKVINSLMQTQTNQITANVKAGKLTQVSATKVKTELQTQIKKAIQQKVTTTTAPTVNGTTSNDRLNAAAKAVGLTEQELKNKADTGQSISQIAKAKNVNEQTVVNAVVTQEKEWISEQLQVKWSQTDGTASGSNADLQRLVDDGYLAKAAAALGLKQQDLLKLLHNGKSLADISKEKGVNLQKLTAPLETLAKEQIQKEVKTAGEHFE